MRIRIMYTWWWCGAGGDEAIQCAAGAAEKRISNALWVGRVQGVVDNPAQQEMYCTPYTCTVHTRARENRIIIIMIIYKRVVTELIIFSVDL